jgi:hypothetical protein
MLELRLARPAAAHLRGLSSERRVGERLQRLVQIGDLGRDAHERLLRVEATVQRVQLLADGVEALEQDVELPVVERSLAIHDPNLRQRARPRR